MEELRTELEHDLVPEEKIVATLGDLLVKSAVGQPTCDKVVHIVCRPLVLRRTSPGARRGRSHVSSLSDVQFGGRTSVVSKSVVKLRADRTNSGLGATTSTGVPVHVADDVLHWRDDALCLPLAYVPREAVRIAVVLDIGVDPLSRGVSEVGLSLVTVVNAGSEAVLFLVLAVKVIADGNFRGPREEGLGLAEVGQEPTSFTIAERLSPWHALPFRGVYRDLLIQLIEEREGVKFLRGGEGPTGLVGELVEDIIFASLPEEAVRGRLVP